MEIGPLIDTARKIIESGQEHTPILYAETSSGETLLIGIILNDRTKQVFKAAVIQLLRDNHVHQYAFIHEAWAVRGKAAEKAIQNGVRIRDMPLDDREEVLIIWTHERHQAPKFYQAPIHNAPQGRKLGELVELPLGSIPSGRMVIEDW